MHDLRAFLSRLRDERDLHEIEGPVDPRLEIPEIHRRVIERGGPALLFRRPKGSDLPVVTNLFGTAKRIEMAFGSRPKEFVRTLARAATELVPPTLPSLFRFRSLFAQGARVGTRAAARPTVTEIVEDDPDLGRLPALTLWPEDGGPFLTLPLVYTEAPAGTHAKKESNLGIYRMQVYGPRETGMHWQIGKGGGFHYHAAEERGEALPVTVFLGGPPALMLAAVAPLPEGVPEILLASLVLGGKLPVTRVPGAPHRLVADAEIALVGSVAPRLRRPEGPFGDHYGYYSLTHDYPVFRASRLFRRRHAIFPATVVGKPRQEDFFLGDYLQELLSPLYPLVMPAVRDLWSYGETGFHSLAAAVVKDRYPREALASAFRILGEGQLSLTKMLLATDAPRDLRDFKGLLVHLLERCRFETDLFVFANTSMDTLDYAGPKVNEGSKAVLLGLGEAIRTLPAEVPGTLPQGVGFAAPFCPGALVVGGPRYDEEPGFAGRIAADPALAAWPLVVVSDEPALASRSAADFLWAVFTRFDPAGDLHAAEKRIVRNHVSFTPPVILDARMKPWMPKEVAPDPETVRLVDRRWREYFPTENVNAV